MLFYKKALVKSIGENQNIGGGKSVALTDEYMGVFQLLGKRARAVSPKVYAYVWALAPFVRLCKVSFKFILPAPPPGKIVLSRCLVHQFGILSPW